MQKYIINKGYSNTTEVEADEIRDTEGFVDFYDDEDVLVLRMRRDDVLRVELKKE